MAESIRQKLKEILDKKCQVCSHAALWKEYKSEDEIVQDIIDLFPEQDQKLIMDTVDALCGVINRHRHSEQEVISKIKLIAKEQKADPRSTTQWRYFIIDGTDFDNLMKGLKE